MKSKSLLAAFPRLADTFWQISSPFDPTYNCIAWAVNDTDRWWQPFGPAEDYYWPQGVQRANTLDAYIEAYKTLGFAPCEMNFEVEPGYEKIALFTKDRTGVMEASHAAKLLSNGCWASKMGKSQDIEHHDLSAVEGAMYGQVACILKRLSNN